MSLAISKFKSIFSYKIYHKSCKIQDYKFAFHGEHSVLVKMDATKNKWLQIWMTGYRSELPVPKVELVSCFLRKSIFFKMGWNAQKTKNIFFFFGGCGWVNENTWNYY